MTSDYLSWSGSNSSSVNNPGPGETIGTATLATVEWIKTAATVGNGSISAGTVGIVTFNGTQIGSINLTGTTNIISPTPPTCSVNANSTQTVNLGDYRTTDFSGAGSMTPAKAFNINFNCSGGTTGQSRKIYLTMTDATVPANRTSNLNLTTTSTAKGVAVRIQRDAGKTDVVYGADSTTIGNANQWQAGTVATGTPTFSVPLQASMIQTATVTTGSVSAKTTFTVAYN
jgi:type 1 fimbria pilin